jgi:hypothetical protein
MLVQREMSPKAKFVPRKRWGKSRWYTDSSCGTNNESMKETGQSLTSWYTLCFLSLYLHRTLFKLIVIGDSL